MQKIKINYSDTPTLEFGYIDLMNEGNRYKLLGKIKEEHRLAHTLTAIFDKQFRKAVTPSLFERWFPSLFPPKEWQPEPSQLEYLRELLPSLTDVEFEILVQKAILKSNKDTKFFYEMQGVLYEQRTSLKHDNLERCTEQCYVFAKVKNEKVISVFTRANTNHNLEKNRVRENIFIVQTPMYWVRSVINEDQPKIKNLAVRLHSYIADIFDATHIVCNPLEMMVRAFERANLGDIIQKLSKENDTILNKLISTNDCVYMHYNPHLITVTPEFRNFHNIYGKD